MPFAHSVAGRIRCDAVRCGLFVYRLHFGMMQHMCAYVGGWGGGAVPGDYLAVLDKLKNLMAKQTTRTIIFKRCMFCFC